MPSEPSNPHFSQKRFGYLQARTIPNDAVNSTCGTKRGLIIPINPFDDSTWAEYLNAIEATAVLAALNFRTMTAALLMRHSQRVILGKVTSAGHASPVLLWASGADSVSATRHDAPAQDGGLR
jgi:hypothetical protein